MLPNVWRGKADLGLTSGQVGLLAGKGQSAAALPNSANFVVEAEGDVSGKHGILRKAGGEDPRRVESVAIRLDEGEDDFEVRNVFAVGVGTRHRRLGVDDAVVAEAPTSVRRRKAEPSETVAGSGDVTRRSPAYA